MGPSKEHITQANEDYKERIPVLQYFFSAGWKKRETENGKKMVAGAGFEPAASGL
jgi:hypothetical protein